MDIAPLRVAIIGLDSSHAVEFTRRMQAPDCPEPLRVPGLRATTCLRFPSPFQDEAGQDRRQAQLQAWGVRPASDLDDAVAGVDAVMLEINDPAQHLAWFRRVAALGRPVFIDKPLADCAAAGMEILALADNAGCRVCSASPLRSDVHLNRACAALPRPTQAMVYGPLGKAPAGSSLVWYGVHAVEMLDRAMGPGARTVAARRDASGATLVVDYADGRRGVVELTAGAWMYGGVLRDAKAAQHFSVDNGAYYSAQLREVERFFRGGEPPATLAQAHAVLAILDAAQRAIDGSGEAAVAG